MIINLAQFCHKKINNRKISQILHIVKKNIKIKQNKTIMKGKRETNTAPM